MLRDTQIRSCPHYFHLRGHQQHEWRARWGEILLSAKKIFAKKSRQTCLFSATILAGRRVHYDTGNRRGRTSILKGVSP